MNRNQFIKKIGSGSLALALAPQMLWAKETSASKKITILHTNDQHSRIEPFDATYTKNPNQGGFARRAQIIEQIRKQEKNVLLLDSGDIFQGTPYFNFFGGELELKLMSMMKYDASTMGNHDFDNGLEGFLKALPNAQFPFLCSNYVFDRTILEGKTQPYKIFTKEGIKIGVFGIGIKLDGLVGKKNFLETQVLDPIETAQHYANVLKIEKKCDIVICLSHLGYAYKEEPTKMCDKILASATENIDLILGGHTHTFLKTPEYHTNKAGKNTLINQVGWAGLMLGRVDFHLDYKNNLQNISFINQPINDSTTALI